MSDNVFIEVCALDPKDLIPYIDGEEASYRWMMLNIAHIVAIEKMPAVVEERPLIRIMTTRGEVYTNEDYLGIQKEIETAQAEARRHTEI